MVMCWIEKQIKDESVFPTKYGESTVSLMEMGENPSIKFSLICIVPKTTECHG